MNRRNIIIIIIILTLGVAGALFYLSKKQPQQITQTPGQLQIKKVLDERVISPVAAYDNNSIWYFNTEGRLFKANTDGSNLSEYPLPSAGNSSLRQVLWPKTGADFITIPNSVQATKDYYNSASKIFIHLANNIQWLDWLPDGKRIVYIWQSDDQKSQQLAISDADGTGYKSVASVFWPDLALKASPDGKTVLMYRTSIAGDTNKIYAVNLETGEISILVNQGKNTGAIWLPSGTKFLFSQEGKILIYDLARKEVVDLNLNTTLDKLAVTGDGKSLYAAVPKDNSGDSFVKVDLGSFISENYFSTGGGSASGGESSPEIHVKNIMLVGNTVYYISSTDGKLYMIGS